MTTGIVYDMPDHEYRSRPGIHSTSLKAMLDCPARYRQYVTAPPEGKPAYDMGHAVHYLVLGAGTEPVLVAADSRRGKETRAAIDAAHAEGKAPLLTAEYDQAVACAAAVRDHPLAGPFLTRPGHSEVSVFWTDDETGLPCKARIDRVTIHDGVHYLLDLKTSSRAVNPRHLGRTGGDFGYHVQASFYRHGYATAAGIPPGQVEWLNVWAETAPPHLVAVTAWDVTSLTTGRDAWETALTRIAECSDTGHWPGYTTAEAAIISLPPYMRRIHDE